MSIYQNRNINETVWIQVGNTWDGNNIVDSKALNGQGPVTLDCVSNTAYYLYISPKPNYTTTTLFDTTGTSTEIPVTYVTNGSSTGYRTTNPVTFTSNRTLEWRHSGVM